MKVLITGGSGFIGSHLINELIDSSEIIVSSRHPNKYFTDDKRIKYIHHSELLSKEKFPSDINILIHLASLNQVNSEKYPELAEKINVLDSIGIINNAILKGVKKVIYFSTVQVYGSYLIGHINEKSPTNPENIYASTHCQVENYILNISNENSRTIFLIIRLSNSFGIPRNYNSDIWNNFINNICLRAWVNKTITINSNPNIKRDFVPISEVVRCVKYLSGLMIKGTYIINITSELTFSLLEIANTIISYSKNEGATCSLILKSKCEMTNDFKFENTTLNYFGYKLENVILSEIYKLYNYCKENFLLTDEKK